MEWLNNVSQEAWTVIIGLVTTYGGTFIAWLIAYIKMKLKQLDLTKTIEEMNEICTAKMLESTDKLQKTVDERLNSIEHKVLLKINENEDERKKQIDEAASDFESALNELKSDTSKVENTTNN